jgi:glycyl-tRNA synthetase beta chain
VDAFFDQVMVMDEDRELRANRLGLLAQLQGLFSGVADLSRLPG